MDTQYIKSILPSLEKGQNLAHCAMFEKYLQSPVHFTMDRHSQNDLILRGKSLDFEWVLPYSSMSIQLDRTISINRDDGYTVKLETVYVGINDANVPIVTGIPKLMVNDLANKLIWLQNNATSCEQVNQVLASHNVTWSLSDKARIGDMLDTIHIRDLLKHEGNTIINEYLNSLLTDVVPVKAFTFFVTFSVIRNGEWEKGHVYDWVNTSPMFEITQSVNRQYFQDGFNDVIYDYVFDMIKGFTNAWLNQKIVETKAKPTFSQKRAIRRSQKTGSPIRFRSLTYDVNAGSMVTTKTASEGSESQNTGITVTPHNRSETHAFTWVLECNMLDSEIAYDTRNHPKTGKPIVKVLRPRKGAKVNGGSDAKPVIGHIKAL